ncbi:hypothetical protein IFM89_013219 [Coptis chinensis]|uniref:Pentatricopeptide repeat-containing protein n=1 Tax=Coptis chinensis TaxID=261450 RepID=A0A835INH0_9MAGN|nr:hypothetical protein IFM89_013219 [Coptis chinensis]
MESGSEGYSHRMGNRKREGSYEKSRTRTRPMGVDNSEVSFMEGNNDVTRHVDNSEVSFMEGNNGVTRDVKEGFSRKGGRGSIEDSSGRSKIGFRKRNNGVLKESNKFGWRRGSSEDGRAGSFQGSSRHKLEVGETNMDLSRERGLEEEKDEGSLTKTNRKWTNGVTSRFDVKHLTRKDHRFSGSYRNMNVVKRPGDDEDLHEVGLDQKRNRIDLQKKKLISNETRVTTQVRNVERANEFTRISKEAPERQQSYRYSGSKVSESSLNQTLTDWEEFSQSSSEMKLGEIGSSKVADVNVKDLYRKSNNSVNSIRVENDSSYVNQINMRANGNVFDAEKLRSRSTNSYIRLDSDNTQTEDTRKKVSLKSGTLTRVHKFDKDVDENDMDMERAAFKSFEVFTDVRGRPRVSWLNGTDINMPEWLFSKMIHSARIKFSDHSVLRVIQILGTLGNWRRVLQIIQWLQSRERFKSYKTRYIYTAALDVLGKAKRPEGFSSYPDLAAYRCIAVTLGQAGHMKELFDVIDCMRSPPQHKFKTGLIEKWDPRLEPDIIVYNAVSNLAMVTVLNACAQRKQWEGAFWVLQQIKQQGLQPSSTTYGLIMEDRISSLFGQQVMFACEKYNLVYEFFKKVEKITIPNSLNYKVLVNTLWKEGKADEAVLAVKDMERRGVVGSASLYYDLARCLCSAGRCQEALMQMDKICKVAHKPLVVTYTGLIQACLDAGSVQDGGFIFKQMQEFCSPNLVTCNIMLKAYLEHKMFEDAKDLFQKMLDGSCHITKRSDCKNTVTPDSYTFNTMLDSCAAENKWDYFTYCFQQMLHRGYNFNTKRHQRMILEACRAGKVELLETTWKHLVRANRVPPPPLVKERFCMKLEKNDYDTAISSISSHPPNELRLQAFSEKGWLDLLKANTDRFQKDTITSLTHKLSILVAGNEQPLPAIKNLISSCKEYIRTQTVAAEINEAENICLT